MTTSTSPDVIAQVDATIEARHLLKHPFYQAWTEGRLTLDHLRQYAKQYWHHVLAFPQYVSAAHARCPDMDDRQTLLENLIEEERGPDNHPELWLRFGEALGLSRDEIVNSEPLPETAALVRTYRELCGPSAEGFVEGAVALYAYESQVPAVAEAKIDGLRRIYGIDDERGLSFFAVHLQADVEHAEDGRRMIARHAADEASAERARRAAAVAADALWGMLDGVYDRYVAA